MAKYIVHIQMSGEYDIERPETLEELREMIRDQNNDTLPGIIDGCLADYDTGSAIWDMELVEVYTDDFKFVGERDYR